MGCTWLVPELPPAAWPVCSRRWMSGCRPCCRTSLPLQTCLGNTAHSRTAGSSSRSNNNSRNRKPTLGCGLVG